MTLAARFSCPHATKMADCKAMGGKAGVPVYEDETVESLLSDRGVIIQKRKGYRFSVDAILLAAIASEVRCTSHTRYLDVGTGCGIIPILISRRYEELRSYAVEIQKSLADMARRNCALHGLDDRIEVLCLDLRTLPDVFPSGSFDFITSNPPYRKIASGRINPDPEKAAARHEIHSSLGEILAVAAHLLRKKGRLFMIYPASRLSDLIAQCRLVGFTPKRLRPVYPGPGQTAKRILVEAILGGGDEVCVERPLFLRDEKGEYTEEVQRIYRGES